MGSMMNQLGMIPCGMDQEPLVQSRWPRKAIQFAHKNSFEALEDKENENNMFWQSVEELEDEKKDAQEALW